MRKTEWIRHVHIKEDHSGGLIQTLDRLTDRQTTVAANAASCGAIELSRRLGTEVTRLKSSRVKAL